MQRLTLLDGYVGKDCAEKGLNYYLFLSVFSVILTISVSVCVALSMDLVDTLWHRPQSILDDKGASKTATVEDDDEAFEEEAPSYAKNAIAQVEHVPSPSARPNTGFTAEPEPQEKKKPVQTINVTVITRREKRRPLNSLLLKHPMVISSLLTIMASFLLAVYSILWIASVCLFLVILVNHI